MKTKLPVSGAERINRFGHSSSPSREPPLREKVGSGCQCRKSSLLNAGEIEGYSYQGDSSRIKECLETAGVLPGLGLPLSKGCSVTGMVKEEPLPHGGRDDWDLLVWLKCLLYPVSQVMLATCWAML